MHTLFMSIIALSANVIQSSDSWLASHISAVQNPILTKASLVITFLGSWIAIVAFAIIFIIYSLFKKDKPKGKPAKPDIISAVFFPCTLIIAELLVLLIKNIVQRARPVGRLIVETDFSFPSGHAAVSMALALALFFILKDKLFLDDKLIEKKKRIKKILLFAALMIYPLLIGLSRIYLNVHWLSDVLAGWLLGVFVTMIMVMIRHHFTAKKSSPAIKN